MATVTDPDGNVAAVNFAITVLAGDATGAAIAASAPTRTPWPHGLGRHHRRARARAHCGCRDAIINVLIAFHVILLSGDQIAQINVAMAAIFALIVRQVVTPTASPKLIGTKVTTPAGAPALVSAASPRQR